MARESPLAMPHRTEGSSDVALPGQARGIFAVRPVGRPDDHLPGNPARARRSRRHDDRAVRHAGGHRGLAGTTRPLSLIHISEPTRRTPISYAVFCLKKKNKKNKN